MTDLEVIQKARDAAIELLSPTERVEYERYRRSGRPSLAWETQQRLYEMFCQGIPCEALSLLNPGLSLGAVCMARVENRWDERKEAYLAELFAGTNERLRQIGAEALEFLGLVLAAAHKEHGDKLRRYLSSGDPKDLGDFRIHNLGQYKTLIETIARLVGADNKKTVQHTGSVTHVTAQSDGIAQPAAAGRLTAKQAALMRAALEDTSA